MSHKLLSEIIAAKKDNIKQEKPIEKATVVGYKLLTQINEFAHKKDEYNTLIENIIDVLGFDRSKVIYTDKDAEDFLEIVEKRPLVEQGERAAVARAGEREWMRDIARKDREERGTEHRGTKLGLTVGKENPKPEDKVLFGRVPTKITDIDRQGGEGVTAVSIPVGNTELIVPRQALVGPKVLGNDTIWMVSKENAQKLVNRFKQQTAR